MANTHKLLMKHLKPEDRLIFLCTRQNFTDSYQQAALNICQNERIKWDVVYVMSQQHGVSPLIFTNFRQFHPLVSYIPHSIIAQFEHDLYQNVATKELMRNKTREVLSFFNQNDIDVMLIKGSAMDLLVYDHPWYTVSGDIDIVLRPKQDEISEKVKRDIDTIIHEIPIFECDYFEHDDVTAGRSFPVNFQRIWEDADKLAFRGCDAWVMSPEDMLISVCINSCRKRYLI